MCLLTLQISVLNKSSRKISLEINVPSYFELIFSTAVLLHRLYRTKIVALDANTQKIITVHMCYGRLKKIQKFLSKFFFRFYSNFLKRFLFFSFSFCFFFFIYSFSFQYTLLGTVLAHNLKYIDEWLIFHYNSNSSGFIVDV